jgi:PAS domain S-box-containing protein
LVDDSGDLDKLPSDLKDLLLDLTSDSIFLHDQEGNFIYINQAAHKKLGYTKEELMAMNLHDLNVPEFTAQIKSRINDLMEKGESTFEAAHYRKDGTVMPVEINSRIIEYENQNFVLSSVRDIPQRKKAENALSRELEVNSDLNKLSRKLLESAPIEDISDMVLKDAQKFTHSKFGFVGYIDPKTGYLISPTMTRNIWTECHVKDKSVIFEKFGGMWGWVLNNKKSLLTNHPKDDHRSTGTPSGHIAIETYLAVPALVDENLVGIISLANSDKYDKQDLEVIERLSDLYAIAITRKHSDDAIRKSEEKYRTIVEKFLKVSNEIIIDINK